MDRPTRGPALDTDDLMARCLGNADFAGHILAKFQDRCAADLAALDRAVTAAEGRTVAALAHRIKGASANASATAIRALAAQIEDAAPNGPLSGIADQLADLKDEWRRFTQAAADFVSSHRASV
ncbi:MAG: Hpt domain-containing protein [Pirellulales bacterium]|nr:Hpt domain-containing protein [Pirellulales bacterium]